MLAGEIKRLSWMIILGFAILALGTAFWSILRADSLKARFDNPRRVLAELNIERGLILDRHGATLAYTEAATNPRLGARRIYPEAEAVSAIGYYSYQFGAAGLEEHYDAWLRGADLRDLQTILTDDLLNRNISGGDLRSTIDLSSQQALAEAIQGRGQGGGVLIAHVPSGAVLGLVSWPSFDPNQPNMLARLVADDTPESPNGRLFNRVTNGRYQPGGLLQTLWLSDLLANGASLDDLSSLEAIHLSALDLTLDCALPAESDSPITLAEAYRRGCPAPFAASWEDGLSASSLENRLATAGFWREARLDGYPILLEPLAPLSADDFDLAEVLGQGRLLLSPAQAAQIIAALVNEGRGLPLHLAAALREPNSETWQPIRVPASDLALMQPSVAGQLRGALQIQNWGSAERPIYGHFSRALAGQREVIWFLGWTPLANGDDIIIVIVLEGTQIEAADALQIAQIALPIAARVFEP